MRDTYCQSPQGWSLFQCAHGSRVWLPKRCRHCDPCHTARRNKTIVKILNGLQGDSHPGLLTLTSTPGTTWPTIMKRWSQMARYIRRTSPQMTYAAVKEEGAASGMRHLHLIMRSFNFTPQAELSKEWARLTGAWVVDIQRVDGAKAAAYVAKYVSKGQLRAAKVTTFGKGWPKLPPLPRTTQKVGDCGPWGPSKVASLTADGGIVDTIAPDCPCWGDLSPPDVYFHLWLKSSKGP